MSDSEEKKELLFGKVLMGTGGPIFKLPKQSIQKPVIAFLKELKKTTSQYINNEYISKNDFFEMKRKQYNEENSTEPIDNVPAYKRHLKATGNQYNEMLEIYIDYNKEVKYKKENRPFKKESFNLILQKKKGGGSKNNNRKTKHNNRKTKHNNRKTKKNKK